MKERLKLLGYRFGMFIAGRCLPPYECYWGRRALEAEKEARQCKKEAKSLRMSLFITNLKLITAEEVIIELENNLKHQHEIHQPPQFTRANR